jgi:hypothetical protein
MRKILAAIALSSIALTASATGVATVNLSSFIQNGTVTNGAASTSNITSIVYTLGTPGVGVATWDSNGGGNLANGTPSDFLSDNRWFQTITFSGLNVAAGNSYSFSNFSIGNLDIDLIEAFSPTLSVSSQTLDGVGTSLINASMSIFWGNGESATTKLIQQAWILEQNLSFKAGPSAVPVPAAAWLFATGLAGFGAYRRKKLA